MSRHSILGLAIDERGMACAQVLLRGKRQAVQRLGRFEFSADASIDQPEATGKALRTFLDSHHFDAHTAVVGVPARWVIAQERELPPTDAAAAIAMLQLQAERIAVEEMVFDVAGPLASSQPSRVLLVGILKRQLERIEQLCTAAGLTLAGMGPTALALARQLSADERPLVIMGEQDGELVWQRQGVPFMLKHLAGAGGATAASEADAAGAAMEAAAPAASDAAGPGAALAVAGEVRRTLMMRPAQAAAPASLLMWDRRPPHPGEMAELTNRAGLGVERLKTLGPDVPQVDARALNGAAGRESADAYLPPIAVALTALPGDHPAVNFVQPRLVQPRTGRFSRTAVLAIAAAGVVIIGLSALYYTVVSREAETERLALQLSGLKDDVKAAEARLDRFSYGRSFYEQRPPVLDCLVEISSAFGTDRSIWATGFLLRDNNKGSLQGKATNHPAVLGLLDRLKASGKFDDLQLGQSTGTSREVTFSINFTYTGGGDAQ